MYVDIITGTESVETLKEEWALLLVKTSQNNLFLSIRHCFERDKD